MAGRYAQDKDPDWNLELPSGGRVYLTRRNKPNPTYIRLIKAVVFIATLAFVCTSRICISSRSTISSCIPFGDQVGEMMQYDPNSPNVARKGVEQHQGKAMEWFRKAAAQGHAHASYNLAIGHLKGMKTDGKAGNQGHASDNVITDVKAGKAADQGHANASYNMAIGHVKGKKTDLKPGEAHTLIRDAASKGVKQAHNVLNIVCTRGGC